MSQLTHNTTFLNQIKYDEKGLIPAIVQNEQTDEILMVAYMNQESLKMTIETGLATFWSRSRQEFWVKGQTSSNTLAVQSILVDCDADTLIVKAIPAGPACHTGERTCFFRQLAHVDNP